MELQSWTRPEKATGRSDVSRRMMASRARRARKSTRGDGRRVGVEETFVGGLAPEVSGCCDGQKLWAEV